MQQLSAPVTSALAGKAAPDALAGVFKVVNTEAGLSGTGFLHRSGKVITVAHVVKGARPAGIVLVLPPGLKVGVESVVADEILDLAILTPEDIIPRRPLLIKEADSIPTGTQVSTWGFPDGYNAASPMLTVGYIAGVDDELTASGQRVSRFVVNAAFNHGNSGGPLLLMEEGLVVGVVSSKVTPTPLYLENELRALAQQKSGFMYEGTTAEGKKIMLSEARIIGDVLEYLHGQTQLVVGHAVATGDLIGFLRRNHIAP